MKQKSTEIAMNQYRDTVARVFAEVARLSVECVHSEDKLLFTTNLSPAEKEAFPGFVGRKVRPGGLMFLARKGTSGKLDDHRYENEVLANALSSLKDASERTALERFEDLMDHLRAFMCGWGAFRYIKRFLETAQLTMDDISYINFVVFRAAGDKSFRQRVFDQAWNVYTRRILDSIAPGIIVPLGQETGRQIRRFYRGSAKIAEPIHRSRGDRYIPQEGEKDIERAVLLYRRVVAK